MTVKVIRVSNQREFQAFKDFPNFIYQNDPQWQWYHPYKIGDRFPVDIKNVILLLALNNEQVVGRLAGTINCFQPNTDKDLAYFGYWENINHQMVAASLFKVIEQWAINNGCHSLVGPVSFDKYGGLGLLVEGFQVTSQYGTPYNPSYYPLQLENLNFKKEQDLFGYLWSVKKITAFAAKLQKIIQRVQREHNVILRNLNLNQFHQEAALFTNVYNQTMNDYWGFSPLTVKEAALCLHNYRYFADPDLLLVAIINNQPVGLSITLPNKSNGNMVKAKSCRLAVLGITPEFRNKGIVALLIYESFRRVLSKGYREVELSLIEESNKVLNHMLQNNFFLETVKRFRVYRKELVTSLRSSPYTKTEDEP